MTQLLSEWKFWLKQYRVLKLLWSLFLTNRDTENSNILWVTLLLGEKIHLWQHFIRFSTKKIFHTWVHKVGSWRVRDTIPGNVLLKNSCLWLISSTWNKHSQEWNRENTEKKTYFVIRLWLTWSWCVVSLSTLGFN